MDFLFFRRRAKFLVEADKSISIIMDGHKIGLERTAEHIENTACFLLCHYSPEGAENQRYIKMADSLYRNLRGNDEKEAFIKGVDAAFVKIATDRFFMADMKSFAKEIKKTAFVGHVRQIAAGYRIDISP